MARHSIEANQGLGATPPVIGSHPIALVSKQMNVHHISVIITKLSRGARDTLNKREQDGVRKVNGNRNRNRNSNKNTIWNKADHLQSTVIRFDT